MQDTIFITNHVLPNLVSLILSEGKNPEQMLGKVDIDFASALLDQYDLPLSQMEALLETLMNELDLPHLGLLLGKNMQMNTLGLFGSLVTSSPNLKTAVECFSQFKQLLHPLFDLTTEVKEGMVYVYYQSQDDFPIGDKPFYAELLFASMLSQGRLFTGENHSPTAIHFRHPEPEYVELYQEILQCPTLFNQSVDCMVIPEERYNQPMLSHSFSMHQMLKRQAQALLAEKQPNQICHQVKQGIKANLKDPDFSAEKMAAMMRVSPRTLQRKLSLFDTTFKTLRDEVMVAQAQHLLQTTKLSTESVALEVGYKERSSFVNAFKRLTGQTPSQFRR